MTDTVVQMQTHFHLVPEVWWEDKEPKSVVMRTMGAVEKEMSILFFKNMLCSSEKVGLADY
jgi:hypothetical protein